MWLHYKKSDKFPISKKIRTIINNFSGISLIYRRLYRSGNYKIQIIIKTPDLPFYKSLFSNNFIERAEYLSLGTGRFVRHFLSSRNQYDVKSSFAKQVEMKSFIKHDKIILVFYFHVLQSYQGLVGKATSDLSETISFRVLAVCFKNGVILSDYN